MGELTKILPFKKKEEAPESTDWERVIHNTTRWSCICFGTGIVMTKEKYVYRCRCEKGLMRAESFPRYPEKIERIG